MFGALLFGQLKPVRERLDRGGESVQHGVLLERLDDHVRHNLTLLVLDQHNTIRTFVLAELILDPEETHRNDASLVPLLSGKMYC